MRPAKNQINLRIRAVWSESSLGALWIARDATFLHVGNKGSDYAIALADLSLRWVHMSISTFSHVAAQMFKGENGNIMLEYLIVRDTVSTGIA